VCASPKRERNRYVTERCGRELLESRLGIGRQRTPQFLRDRLAHLLGAKPHELIFTGSGTEANNLAVLGLSRAQRARGRHLICGSTEHHAVLHAFEHLQKQEGFEVTFLRVDSLGQTDPADLAAAIRDDTTLVSIMSANNETGVIQPLRELAEICRARGVLLHSDMVQSFAKQPTDLSLVDAASFAAHKFYGPKGAGLLFLRAGLPIESIQFGGAHENQRRPGTENVPAIEASYKARDVEGFLDIHFYRKIGFQLALLFAKLKMTPSQVTFCGAVTGIAAALKATTCGPTKSISGASSRSE
jgi:cysteine desulfurase